MSKLKIFNEAGELAGEEAFASDLLVLDKGEQAVKDVVTATMNALRAPVASTLSKGEVAGSNKKPWRQKGTGRARAGYRQSPVWRGGGVAFGPRPHDYSQKINRKVAQLAFRRALSEKISGGNLIVIEEIKLAEPKTKLMASLLVKLGVSRSCLVVTDQVTEELQLATRNLPKVEVADASSVDVYSLLRFRSVVATRAALEVLTQRLAGKKQVVA